MGLYQAQKKSDGIFSRYNTIMSVTARRTDTGHNSLTHAHTILLIRFLAAAIDTRALAVGVSLSCLLRVRYTLVTDCLQMEQ